MRRYPVQPLLDATGLTLNGFIRTRMPSVNGPTYRKVRTEGLTADQADRWAVAAGLHPFELWPELVEHALEVHQQPCANETCGRGFVPSRADQRFCCKGCRVRQWERNRYRTDPAYRAAQNQRARDYQQIRRRARRVKRAAA